MITIRPIRMNEIPRAKEIICTIAYDIFGFDGTLEESIRYYTGLGIFSDMDDVQAHYFDNGGIFLAALDDNQVIGSGALRKQDEKITELKRMWLLERYHGQGIGYRIISHLFEFGRSQNYTRIRLQTSPEQTRALAFYRKLGFYEIPCYNEDTSEVSMEIQL